MEHADIILGLVACLASFIGTTARFGGDLVLLGLLFGHVQISALIPLHASVETVRNLPRSLILLRTVSWRLVLLYGIGVILGVLIGVRMAVDFPLGLLSLVLGVTFLVAAWLPPLGFSSDFLGKFAILGGFQGFLSMFIGFAEHLDRPFLERDIRSPNRIEGTLAWQMLILNAAKVAVFTMFGYRVLDFAQSLTMMLVGAIAGFGLGIMAKPFVSERFAQIMLQFIATALALRLFSIALL